MADEVPPFESLRNKLGLALPTLTRAREHSRNELERLRDLAHGLAGADTSIVVRYWRTVAVDYVNKQRERGPESGWALRNIKLRFSRKLTFAAGLLACFGPRLDSAPDAPLFPDEAVARSAVFQDLVERFRRTALDTISAHLTSRAKPETATALLDAYEAFLAALDQPGTREHLRQLSVHAAPNDDVFNRLRQHSAAFQAALNRMFFGDDEQTRDMIQKYGVFGCHTSGSRPGVWREPTSRRRSPPCKRLPPTRSSCQPCASESCSR